MGHESVDVARGLSLSPYNRNAYGYNLLSRGGVSCSLCGV